VPNAAKSDYQETRSQISYQNYCLSQLSDSLFKCGGMQCQEVETISSNKKTLSKSCESFVRV
jgi:hypothetical protein